MRSYAIIVFLLLSTLCKSQDFPIRNYDLEQLAENIFAVQDIDIDYSQLYENLAQILSNPIDLNTATDEQLRSLFILTESQMQALLSYREAAGTLLSVYELQAVPGIDVQTFHRLVPFVTVLHKNNHWKALLQRILKEENKYLLIRSDRALETKLGYSQEASEANRYSGSPERLYTRFRSARSSDFSVGFTLEKDGGERFNWSTQKRYYGFDYTSYHVQALNKGRLMNVIVGDYQAQFGQGLILGGGFGGGKGAETVSTIRRSNLGFLPYTSLGESGYFRGIATSVKVANNFLVHTFISALHRDGNASDSLGLSISSLPISGLHRTINELSNRKAVKETNLGTVVSYKKNAFEAGGIIHHTTFQIPIERTPSRYNQFFFNGSENTNAGIFLNYSFSNATLFSEFAKTANKGNALLIGALASLTPKFDLSLVYRNYDKDFHSFYSNAVSENTGTQNEQGIYLGWKYKFSKRHLVSGYYDMFRFPWLRFRAYTPSYGYEWLSRYTYQLNRDTKLYLQLREESKVRNTQQDAATYTTDSGVKRNFWINLDYKINAHLDFKSRAQFSSFTFNQSTTTGFTLIQDFNFKFKKITLSSRYALFDTDDFDNRQYVYEKDVWLAYSFPFYNGLGTRQYFLVQLQCSKAMDLWIKWSRTEYQNTETIGSGGEQITGNSINDIKLQLRIKL